MTDSKIKKALDESEVFLRNRVKDGQPIKLNECDVGILRNISQVCAKAYDEIDRLQTENKNLKVENQSLRSAANSLKMHYEEAQAEIERLTKSLELVQGAKCVYSYDGETLEYCVHSPCPICKTVDQIKSEAYKEFAERLKIYSCRLKDGHDMVDTICIDNLLKELVGDDNAEM